MCDLTIYHITLRSHNWQFIVMSVGTGFAKQKPKVLIRCEIWVAHYQIALVEKALLKKHIAFGWRRNLSLRPWHPNHISNKAFRQPRVNWDKLIQSQRKNLVVSQFTAGLDIVDYKFVLTMKCKEQTRNKIQFCKFSWQVFRIHL